MNPENGFYGHRYVLGDWMGVDDEVPRYRAHIQHGWAAFSPVGHPERLLTGIPFLAWSSRDVRTLRTMGVRRVTPVGSPMLYLVRGKPRAIATGAGRSKAIVYPPHGWERGRKDGPHARFADEVLERYGVDTTVCLFWIEYRNRAVRGIYESRGFRVITHGLRDDPGFLFRQHEELARHEVVVVNEACTALWYGAAMRLSVVRLGPTFAYEDEYRSRWATYQQVRWPEIGTEELGGDEAAELAEVELGAAHLREPQELLKICRPVAARESARRAARATEFTLRRTLAVVRSRLRPGRIERHALDTMASAGPDGAESDAG